WQAPDWSTNVVHIEVSMRYGHYVHKRGNRFRFRMRYPKALVTFGFSGDLVLNLRTDSRSVAIKRARFARVHAEKLMSELLSMSRGEAEGRVRQWVDDMSTSWETNLETSGGYAFFDKEEVDRMGDEHAGEMDDLF